MRAAIRRVTIVGAAVSAALFAFTPGAGAACTGADLPYSAANEAAIVGAVTCMVNNERVARGLPAVSAQSQLATAARAHSADMAANNYFDHNSQDGTKFSARLTTAGYSWIAAGENIAAGYRTATAVMTGWMASKGHCENILSGAFDELGVGVASGSGTYGVYWTQDFGRRSGSAAQSTAASGCPYKSLVEGTGPNDPTPTCGAAQSPTLKITSLRRVKGGKLRVKGSVAPDGCCQSVRFTIKRGSKTQKTTRSFCGTSFNELLRIPKARGKIRVTVRLGIDGPSAKRTLKA